MPDNCFNWAAEPLAPEWAIIYTELIGWSSDGFDITSSILSATLLVHSDHASTTLLYFSPWVINPSWYWFSYSWTFNWVALRRLSFSDGIIRSSFPNDIPAIAAYLKPICIMWSANKTVSFWPQNL